MHQANMIQELEKLLIATGSYSHKNGSLNVTAVAKASGISQPTLKHMFDGTTKNPRIDLLEKLCELAGVTYGDLCNSSSSRPEGEILSLNEKRLLAAFRALSPKNQKLAIKLVTVIE